MSVNISEWMCDIWSFLPTWFSSRKYKGYPVGSLLIEALLYIYIIWLTYERTSRMLLCRPPIYISGCTTNRQRWRKQQRVYIGPLSKTSFIFLSFSCTTVNMFFFTSVFYLLDTYYDHRWPTSIRAKDSLFLLSSSFL